MNAVFEADSVSSEPLGSSACTVPCMLNTGPAPTSRLKSCVSFCDSAYRKLTGIAMPVNFLYALSQNDTHDFNLLVGAGPVFNMHGTVHAEDPSGSLETESASKTAFMAQGGFEGDYKVSTQFALSGRVLGRYAKA